MKHETATPGNVPWFIIRISIYDSSQTFFSNFISIWQEIIKKMLICYYKIFYSPFLLLLFFMYLRFQFTLFISVVQYILTSLTFFKLYVCHHESNSLLPIASIWNLVHQIKLQSTPFHFSNYLTNMNLLLCNLNVYVIFFKLKPTFHSNVWHPCHPCHQAHKCFEHVHGCPTTNHSDTTIGEKKVRASYWRPDWEIFWLLNKNI